MLTVFRVGLFFLGGVCVLVSVLWVAITTGSLTTALDVLAQEPR